MSLVNWFFKALLLVSLATVHAYAAEYTVHGPDEFIRHYAQPLKQTIEFSVPNEGSSFVLRVHNGWGDARRVRAARISLNGVRVFGPRDFHKGLMDHYDFDDVWGKEKSGRKWRKHKKNYAAWDLSETIIIDKSIALLESNTLEVVLYGIPQKKSGFLSGFLQRIHKYLPPSLQAYIENGSGLAVEVLGFDDELPVISASATPAANDAGWHKSSATVNFECTDSLSGIQGCTDAITLEQDGASQTVLGTAVDNAGNTATTEVSVNIDTTLPKISYGLTPSPNNQGWLNQAVNISYTCSDELSGLPESGCPSSQVIDTQGKDQIITVSVSDIAGNQATSDIQINIDSVAPSLVINSMPAANASGWNNTDVMLDFICADELSGVATCPTSQAFTSEGASILVSNQAFDIAGNSSSASLVLNIDKTSPSIVSNITPAANDEGWYNASAVISYECQDALSGVATCPATTTFATEGVNQEVIATASDHAGNNAESRVSINLDITPPTMVATIEPAANDAGWHNTDVSLNYQCNDSVSGIDVCPEPASVAAEGAGQSIQQAVSDKAGNEFTLATLVNLDKTAPEVTQQLSAPANSVGWHNNQVTVNYECSDALSGVEICPAAYTFVNNGLAQRYETEVTDKAGNSFTVSTEVNLDTQAPEIDFSFPNDGDQLTDPLPIITLNVNDNLALDGASLQLQVIDDLGEFSATCTYSIGVSSCTSSRELMGQVQLVATVADLAGNTSTQTISVQASVDTDGDGILDQNDQCPNTYPNYPVEADGCDETQRDSDGDGVLDVSDAFPHDAAETSDLDGDGIGDNSDSDKDGDNVDNGVDAFPEDPKESSDLDGDGIGDNGDEDRDGDGVINVSDAYPDDKDRSKLPVVTIDSPRTLATVGSSPVSITGTADPSFTVLTVNGASVNINAGKFAAQVAVTEGFNTIVARAVDEQGIVSTASISVSLDLTPPYVTIDSHQHDQVVYSDKIMVSGLINDIVRGTVEAEQASVTVNGLPADIANRSYRAENVTLTEGENKITVIGTDQVGNQTTQIINVVYQIPTGKQIIIEAGQNQTAHINTELDIPLTVKVVDEAGIAVANKNVIFRVSQGSGVVISALDEAARAHVVTTDANGIAAVDFKIGQRAGVSNHKIDAKVVGYDNMVTFYASATGGVGNKISVNSGNNQRGSVFQPLPAPFIVAVTDNGSNVVQGARVQFETTVGGGTFDGGAQSVVVLTDSDGRATAQMTLGSLTGLDQQRVTARLVDAPEGEAITAGFTATGFYPQDPANTAISGSVLNNQDEPLANVTVRVDGTTRQAKTNAQGVFKITEAPVGPVHLVIDGSTTTAEGEYPTLSQNIVTVSGVDNPLAAPVYMVKLNTESAVWAGKEDVEVTLKDVPGFKLEVAKDSVTFPDGSREGQVSVTAVNSSKVPMAPPNGMQPQFIVTIQPTGAKFDPPARLTLPNVDAYTPGAQVEMFSYDHDLEEFVAIGLGSVSADGSVVKSNEGVGVIKAGWHCGAAPGGSGSCGNDDCTGPSCDEPDDPDRGPPDTCSGNPINIATGEKYQVETDYTGAGPFPLTIERTYQSNGFGSGATRGEWSFSNRYQAIGGINWKVNPCNARPPKHCGGISYSIDQKNSNLKIVEPNGAITTFNLQGSNWVNRNPAGGDLIVTNTRHSFNNTYQYDFIFNKPNGEKIHIESNKITRIEDAKGNHKLISMADNTITLTDQFGSSVTYEKDENGKTTKATFTSQNDKTLEFTYEYDDKGRLVRAIYPDAKFKQYHYENERYKDKLTGITDESGVRYATWQYDNFGRAILSEHALEAERKTLRYSKVEPIDFDDPNWEENRQWQEHSVTETNELGKQTTYTFNKFYRTRPTKIEGHASTSCIAANKENTYSLTTGNRLSKTDWKGTKTRYRYNGRGLETLRVEAEGTAQERRFETTWHETKPWVLSRNAAGKTLEYEYDEKGNVIKLTQANRILNFSYTDLGQLEKIDGARTDVTDETHYEYNAVGNLVRTTNALGHVTHLQDYNVFNLPTKKVDANGIVTLLEYDQRGRLSKSTVKSRDGDAVTSYVTNAVGLITKITPPNGSAINFEYDDARRLIAISNKNGERIEYSVDAMGNRTEERILDGSGSLAYRHVNLFDELGRLIKDVGTNEQINLEKYDANGNAIEGIDGNGNATQYAFDPLDRLVSNTNANNDAAQFAYDAKDNLTSVTDQRGLVTQYEYNEHNEVVKLTSPDTGVTTFTRDTAGNITSKTDARGVVANYSYDAINRVLTKTFPSDSSRNISYRYDDQYTAADATSANYNAGKGRLTYAGDHSGSTTYRYDDRGNVIADKRTIKLGSSNKIQETRYGYDLTNELTHMDYPTGIRLYYVRDDLGRVNAIKLAESANVTVDNATTIASNINYLPFGSVTDLTYGNGLNLKREFDRDYRITNIEVSDALDLIYEYDTNNNIVAIDNNLTAEQSVDYEYDVLNRLESEAKNQNQISYEYDQVGNRTLRQLQAMAAANDPQIPDAGNAPATVQAIETTYNYASNSNQLNTIDGKAIAHDAVGNITTLPALTSAHTSGNSTATPALSFTYDAVNRLSTVSKNGTLQASYFYNTQGQRVLKQLHYTGRAADYIAYHYNLMGQIIGETHFNGTTASLHKTYVWLGNMPIAMVDKVGSNDLTVTYIHTDHLNSPRSATNSEKAIVWNWLSDAFGDALANEDVDADGQLIKVDLRFPGQTFDEESRKHYNYFRDYAPGLGRYIESDPIGLLGGINTYLYVESNPNTFQDADGLSKSANRSGGAFNSRNAVRIRNVQKRMNEVREMIVRNQKQQKKTRENIDDVLEGLRDELDQLRKELDELMKPGECVDMSCPWDDDRQEQCSGGPAFNGGRNIQSGCECKLRI